MTWQVLVGDCVELMAGMEAGSVDAICTDPPYGLEFMGKDWDRLWNGTRAAKPEGYIGSDGVRRSKTQPMSATIAQGAPTYVGGKAAQEWHEAWAREALRVLKPGGHLLAFGGTRTYHRLACAVEDAGFEIRDCLAWIYGSGFPKSLDVSKAIDKRRDDAAEIDAVRAWLEARRRETGVSRKEINERMGLASNGGGLASTWTTNQTTRAVPQWEQWLVLKSILRFGDEMDAEVWRLNGRKGQPGEAWDERDVLGRSDDLLGRKSGIGNVVDGHYTVGGTRAEAYDVTAPATDDARRWNGWGTALKPAHEPIVVARKPLAGTVAANCLEHGTGALNIDGCRVATDEDTARARALVRDTAAPFGRGAEMGSDGSPLGRWPANVVLDEEAARLLDEQTGDVSVNAPATWRSGGVGGYHGVGEHRPGDVRSGFGDSGGASRFFYCAKASRAERNAGLDGFEESKSADDGYGTIQQPKLDRAAPRENWQPHRTANHHPTVKPISLMRWLVRLVTPPGGLVLDPFTGSGTTGCAAVLEGVRFVGCEKDAEYAAIAEARIGFWEEHGEDGLEFLARRDEADRQREQLASEGQTDLLTMLAEEEAA